MMSSLGNPNTLSELSLPSLICLKSQSAMQFSNFLKGRLLSRFNMTSTFFPTFKARCLFEPLPYEKIENSFGKPGQVSSSLRTVSVYIPLNGRRETLSSVNFKNSSRKTSKKIRYVRATAGKGQSSNDSDDENDSDNVSASDDDVSEDENNKSSSRTRRRAGSTNGASVNGVGDNDISVELLASLNDSRVILKELHKEASDSYTSYAMSVIVGRALPDLRDGLKPVHRRILFAMHELGLASRKPFRKCARVVGEVLGKYHPHGDTAVYDALVRMAQDFSLRSPLVNGHGNFGSVDADPPAAMRYTECKLQALAEDMLLADIEYKTVDYLPNFDGSVEEPLVLPARLPNLLINGSQGIAVGMATNIPPHNLGEVVDALVALIRNPNATVYELMEHCPGPDFPTGGSILGVDGIVQAYKTGRGSLTVRGQAKIENFEGKTGRHVIIITELPYQTNKALLVEKIAELVNNKVLDGVTDIRDESDRTGMRVVVEVKRGCLPEVVLNSLYKHTSLQSRFSCNMVGVLNGEPKEGILLKDFLNVFLEFRCTVVERRARHMLLKAQDRNHQVEGLLVALGRLDEVVSAIRSSKDSSEASQLLQNDFGLSSAQADGVLGMALRRLTSLELSKLEEEHKQLISEIANLTDLIGSRNRILEVVENEAESLKKQYRTPRRTRIEGNRDGELSDEDLVPNDNTLVVLSEKGYLKRMADDTLSPQSRNTKGRSGGKLKGDDTLSKCFMCKAHDTILLFSSKGTAYTLKAYQIPLSSRMAIGTPIMQILPLDTSEKVTSVLPVSQFAEDQNIIMLTANGWIKRIALTAFANARKNGLLAIQLPPGDELKWVSLASAEDSIVVGSKKGRLVCYNVSKLRLLQRSSRGVTAMQLLEGDCVAGMDVLPEVGQSAVKEEGEVKGGGGPWLLVVTSQGNGKRVVSEAFPKHLHRGQGVRCCKLTEGDSVVSIHVVGGSIEDKEEMVVGSHSGILNRFRVRDIPIQGRPARGVSVMRLQDGDLVKSVALVPSLGILDIGDQAPLQLPELAIA